jgi:hypothetical protein
MEDTMISHDQLPPLQGSPAHVLWAEQARAERIAEMERYADAVVASYSAQLSSEECRRLRWRVIRGFAHLLAQPSAYYWLSLHPSRDVEHLVRAA